MPGARARLSLVEYGAPVDLAKSIAEAASVDRGKARQILLAGGERVASSLGFSANPISVEARGIRATDFAGLIRLGPSLELEIAPKFLGLDSSDARWREDFFFLATLSRHGRLLASERLWASGGAPRDLSTLVARSLSDMYQTRKRRPLRTYRRAKQTDFFLEGDADPMDLCFPGADGFEQELLRFDRSNAWNATIRAAAKDLLPEVSDAAAAASLVRVIEDLAPQSQPASARARSLPGRQRAWQPLYDLSLDVLNGLGLTYKPGQASAPGYVVSTWQVWEDILTIGARVGYGRSAVSAQKGFVLGSRRKPMPEAKTSALSVYPDCLIEATGARPKFLLDAKYKGHIERGPMRIAEADVYEAMAFAKASNCDLVVLAYPALPGATAAEPGTIAVFERVDAHPVRIVGVQAEVRGISRSGSLKLFSMNLTDGLERAVYETTA